jgi:uncharacterized protein YkwD
MRKIGCVLLIALVAAFAGSALTARPAAAFDRLADERTVLKLINNAREKRGLAKVRINRALDRAALAHSRELLASDRFSHTSSDGTSLGTRLRRAGYGTSGYSSWSVSEVIGMGQGTLGTPRAVFKAWMGSRAHRSIILNKRWRDAGVGCAHGTFGDSDDVVVYTVDFGRRTR